jgi:hypothetical protein
MRANVPHYIRKNEAARIPERFIILDTEAHRARDRQGETQSWALACAAQLTVQRNGTITQSMSRFSDPTSLWRWISDFTRQKRRTVLYAHNLNYDLRISQALSQLPALGWTLQDMRLDGRGSWSRWTRNHATLLLCDSASIFPVPLDQLASTLGMTKLPLPASSAREKLFARCQRDVEILAAGIEAYVIWLRSGMAGNWQMTGAAQSWSHFRHSHMTHRILIHNDSEAIAAERAAMHTGRAEAWQWGKIDRDKLWEYDWSNSYPRIAQSEDLPASLFGTCSVSDAGKLPGMWRKYKVLADVTISVRQPCVPMSTGERTIWPTGVFRTMLWDPELALVMQHGEITEVHKVWLYRKAPLLKDWAEWILSSLGKTDQSVPEWQKLILKHWSRALIGRFGMRYKQWQKFATAPTSRIFCSELYDRESGERSEIMQVGTDVFTLGELTETNDACPQITSYIMSAARAKLWRVCSSVGRDNVVYMDTDSLVVSFKGHNTIQSANGRGDFAGLRSKGVYRSAHIYGPRSAIFSGRPCVAGMPRKPVQEDFHKWRGEIWRSCQESIRRGEHDTVSVAARSFTLNYNTNRRAFLDNGGTAPYQWPGREPDNTNRTYPAHPRSRAIDDYPALRPLLAAAKGRNRLARPAAIPIRM